RHGGTGDMPSGPLRRCFPFSAVSGMDDVKKALMCAAADDNILGVLIKGPAGTAKSVLVRSFVNILPDKRIVNVPQNVTSEDLYGGLDIEEAIIFGKTVVKGGIMQRADNNILYADNINLFDTGIISSMLGCAESGKVIVEREGISAEYDLDTTIIATMDPAEGALPEGMADRFDICVQTHSLNEKEERDSMITSNLEFDADPEGFAERYSAPDNEILKKIKEARKILKDVKITASDLVKISDVCVNMKVKGHRADISVARVSRVLAALDGRTEVSDGDIKEAAVLCLLHRRTETKKERKKEQPLPAEGPKKDIDITIDDMPVLTSDLSEPVRPYRMGVIENTLNTDPEYITYDPSGDIIDLGTVAEIIGSVNERLDDMEIIEAVRLLGIGGGTGRRKEMVSKGRTGRYSGSRIPEGKTTDVAFDATVRAAAPYQRSRSDKGLSISIEKQDVREKIRERKDSCSFLFAVDLSGSLVKCGMMEDIKDGIKGMLMDNYVRRDKVALMTFRTYDVRISVPFTRSVEGICDTLENTETGGGTPLGAALLLIRKYLLGHLRKNRNERCFVVLMTDGETTDPVIDGEPWGELKKITATMNIPRTEWIVVDSGLFTGRINFALRLSKMLGAGYIKLGDLGSV
ncbi:MAG: VWA domain-containing protein, partial [Methanomassiliicoccaceae archaeon]|nr:VWA domain-containing protein [Methanomassiliicoccaceae archaeon]